MSKRKPIPETRANIPRCHETAPQTESAAVAWLERFLFRAPLWRFAAALVLANLLRTGVSIMPNLRLSLDIARQPFQNPFDDPRAYYLYWNWLGPFLAWVIGARSAPAFLLFHVAAIVSFTLCFFWISLRSLPPREARVALVLFTALPVSSTGYYWIGMDGITLLLMLCVLAAPHFIIVFIAAAALAMQHFEQGIVAMGLVLIACVLSRAVDARPSYSLRSAIAACCGLIAGKCALYGIFLYNGAQTDSGRVHWIWQRLAELPLEFLNSPHAILWSVLGPFWLVVAAKLADRKLIVPFLVPFVGLLCLSLLLEDQTRNVALAAFPLTVVCWLWNLPALQAISNRLVAWVALVFILTPWVWVWIGVPRGSMLSTDIAVLLQLIRQQMGI